MINERSDRATSLYPEPPLVIPPGSFKGDAQELARVIEKQVENYPASFDMGSYIDSDGPSIYSLESAQHDTKLADWVEEKLAAIKAVDGTTLCGTTMCLAGYAQLFVDGDITNDVERRAAELLGLSYDGEGSTDLFFVDNTTARTMLKRLADNGFFTEQDLEEISVARRKDADDGGCGIPGCCVHA